MKHEQHLNDVVSAQEKEILDILMDSDLYFDMPLKERHLLFRHIIQEYLRSIPSDTPNC